MNKTSSRLCDACQLGKTCKLSFSSSDFVSSRPLERIHSFFTASFLGNLLPSSVLPDNKSPYELLIGKPPVYTSLRVFGSACYPYLRPYSKNKFDPRSLLCVFLGYNEKYKGYRCLYPPTGKVYICRHVLFDESRFPFQTEYASLIPTATSPLLSSWQQSFVQASQHKDNVSQSQSSQTTAPVITVMQGCPERTTAFDAASIGDSVPVLTDNSPQPLLISSSPATPRTPPATTSSSITPATTPSDSLFSEEDFPPLNSPSLSSPPQVPNNTHSMVTRAKDGIRKPNPRYALHTVKSNYPEPKTVKTALKDPGWTDAMTEEVDTMHETETWDLAHFHEGGLFLNQEKYATDLLITAGMADCAPMPTPLPLQPGKFSGNSKPFSDPTYFRSLAGKLQYLTLTRPDIQFAVNFVCQKMHTPSEDDFNLLKRIIRYIKGTLSLGINFSNSTDSVLRAYSDSDWSGCKDTSRSTGGFCTFLGENIISWSSKRHGTVSHSSTKAEYRTMSLASREIMWLNSLLRETGVAQPITPEMYCDNLSAVHLTANPALHSKSKHFARDFHHVREQVALGALIVKHVPATQQIADVFTKSLPQQAFCDLRSKLGVCSPPTPSLRGSMKSKNPLTATEASNITQHKDNGPQEAQFRSAIVTGQETKPINSVSIAVKSRVSQGCCDPRTAMQRHQIYLRNRFSPLGSSVMTGTCH
ncbi:unnamed protein product [Arabidopsis halleri]